MVTKFKYREYTYDGRKRVPPVESLQAYLRAYGRGEEATLARMAFAKRVGTSLQYVTQIAVGIRRSGVEMAMNIEKSSHGVVRCEELNPDVDWAYLAKRRPLARKPRARVTRKKAKRKLQSIAAVPREILSAAPAPGA